ncbi:hypothetical protein EIN_183090 [Entamoeba invadens IP1]|uniref:hypothetical protein n=1 Tax=Entamoeba invadens IP1 TaxID=370355 RepID=UPI0002C3EF7D|nr:hypothetical protein EIN_183090 [Entamoeba invadens IP1]ELP94052.1 hypothetical protein EIN_183090 [Entamoeba invadens IP1]|eukprot:XP_004260823.1 hypothetical protein EIN_183090 [Entamoeba invadens IP1]
MRKLFELKDIESSYNSLLNVPIPQELPDYNPPSQNQILKVICIDGTMYLDEFLCKKLGGLFVKHFTSCGSCKESPPNTTLYVRTTKAIIQSIVRPLYSHNTQSPLYIQKVFTVENVNNLLFTVFDLQLTLKLLLYELIDWMRDHPSYTIPPQLERNVLNSFDFKLPHDVVIISFLYKRLNSVYLRRQCLESYITVNGLSSLKENSPESAGGLTSYVVSQIVSGRSLFPSILSEILAGLIQPTEMSGILKCCLYLLQDENNRKNFVFRGNLVSLMNKIDEKSDSEIKLLFLHVFAICAQETDVQTKMWNDGLYKYSVKISEALNTDEGFYDVLTAIGAYSGNTTNNANLITENVHRYILKHIQSNSKDLRDCISLIATEALNKMLATVQINKEDKENFCKTLLDLLDESMYVPTIVNSLQILKTLGGDNSQNKLFGRRWYSFSRLANRMQNEKDIIIGIFSLCCNRFRDKVTPAESEEMRVYTGIMLNHLDDEEIVTSGISLFQVVTNENKWCEVAYKNGLHLVIGEILKKYKKTEMIVVCAITLLFNLITNNQGIHEMYSMQIGDSLCDEMEIFQQNSLIQDHSGCVLIKLITNTPTKEEIYRWGKRCYLAALEFVGNATIQKNSLILSLAFLNITNDFEKFNEEGWLDIFEITMRTYECEVAVEYHGLDLLLFLLKRQQLKVETNLMEYFSVVAMKYSLSQTILSLVCECVFNLVSPSCNEWKENLCFLKQQTFMINMEKFINLYSNDIQLQLRFQILKIYQEFVPTDKEDVMTLHYTTHEFLASTLGNDYITNATLEEKTVADFLQKISEFDYDQETIVAAVATLAVFSHTTQFTSKAFDFIKKVATRLFKTDCSQTRKFCGLFFAFLPNNIYEIDAVANYTEAICSAMLGNFLIAEKEFDVLYVTFITVTKMVKSVTTCKSVVNQFNATNTINNMIDKLRKIAPEEITSAGDLLLQAIC